ncbi:MAG: sigma-70 family RNA polymerase sigma factor, partial [Planctomycetes bacterium]|nr:sigma-70 family RNA polymerase sigma factor [Planctomycetota bacterium]
MVPTQLTPTFRRLDRLADDAAGEQRTDAQLLRAFAQDHDEAAFAAIVRRHSTLVLGVCRRALNHHMKAKRSARQRRLSAFVADTLSAAPSDDLTWREVLAVLDEEVQRLPEVCRRVFVECCLNEQSKPEVARKLGLKEGTVSSRLARARRQLQERLARRGVTLSAVLTVAGLAPVPRASAAAVKTTARAAARLVAGDAPADVVPAHVLSIARGV